MAERLTPPYDTSDGRVCSCMLKALPLVEYRFLQAGWIREDFSGLVSQWGYRGGATAASAGTHDGGGVLDVRWTLVDSNAKLRVWLECGVIMFPRFSPPFDARHGHGVLAGCPHVHWSAANQVTSYRNGNDGLANPRPYPGPDVPYRTWQRAQVVYADLIEEMQMPTSREIAAAVLSYPIDDHDHDLRWGIDSIRDALLRIGPRTSEINDKLDEVLAASEAFVKALAELRADLAELADDPNPSPGDVPLPSPAEE